MVNVGDFTKLVTVKYCTVSQGADGAKVRTWSTYGNVWAKVDTYVNESVADYNLESGRTLKITMWRIFAKDKEPMTWQVVIDGQAYEVVSKDRLEKMYDVITAKAIKQ